MEIYCSRYSILEAPLIYSDSKNYTIFPYWKSVRRLPLIHNDRVIGVLALFSKKKLNTADFELLVYLYFCVFNTEYW